MFWKKKKIKADGLVAIETTTGGIGDKGKLVWKNKLDMQWFVKFTKSKKNPVLICGGETYRSFGNKPLKDRHMIVISRKLIEEVKNIPDRKYDIGNIAPILMKDINLCKDGYFLQTECYEEFGSRYIDISLRHCLFDIECHFTNNIHGIKRILEKIEKGPAKRFGKVNPIIIGGSTLYTHFIKLDKEIEIDKMYISCLQIDPIPEFDTFFKKDSLMKNYKLLETDKETIAPDIIEVWKKR